MLLDNVSEWVSDARFAPFLAAAGGNREAAVALYQWHARMCGVAYATLHHFEVLVRNTVDRTLGAGQPDSPLESTWLLDPNVLTEFGGRAVTDVVERLEKEGKPRVRSRVVAGLTFAFWKDMFTRHYETVWVAQLSRGFPGAGLRERVVQPMIRLHLWRNRLAHHDPLLDEAVGERLADMLTVAGFIAPEAAKWLESQSEMATVLAARP